MYCGRRWKCGWHRLARELGERRMATGHFSTISVGVFLASSFLLNPAAWAGSPAGLGSQDGRPLSGSMSEPATLPAPISQATSTPFSTGNTQSSSTSSSSFNPKSSFAESFADLIRKANAPQSVTASPDAPVESEPHYGQPFADSLNEVKTTKASNGAIGADGAALPKTLAPFTRFTGFAPNRGITLPRPLNIPADSSPSLKQAASLIPNLSVVSPALLRGAQPSPDALDLLKKSGIKTVINLRNEPILVAQEAAAAKKIGLDYVNIPMNLFEPPSKQQFQMFLATVDRAPGPVFVHCMRGEDRTGAMIAIYRMARQGWDVNRAYQEMTAMGFKTYLGVLSGAVYDYSAALGRPARRPPVDLRLGGWR
jgi:tyrosine-protein phosphatase SIW14